MSQAVNERLKEFIGEGDPRSAFISVVIGIAKIAAVVFFMVALAYILLYTFAGTQDISIRMIDILKSAKNPILLLIPYFILSGFCGYYYKGTKRRLYFMIVANMYLVLAILFFSHTFRYAIYDISADVGIELNIDAVYLGLDISLIAFIMCIIPLSSMLLAYLEYKENKSDAAT